MKLFLALIACASASLIMLTSNTTGPFNPGKTSVKPFLWVTAKSGVTLSGSSATAWADQTTNGFNLAPLNTNPTYSSTGMNGSYPTLTFNGTADNMGRIGIGGSTRTKFSFWGLVEPLGYANFDALWWMPTTNSWVGNNNDVYLQDGSNSNSISYWQSGVGQKTNTSANTFKNSVVYEIAGTYDGSSSAIYINNHATTQSFSNGQIGNRIVLAGLQPGSAGFNWHGAISEMAFYPDVLSTTDRTNLHTYAQFNWFPAWHGNTNSINFDGSTGYLNGGTSDMNFDYTQPFTISAWARPTTGFGAISKISIFAKETATSDHRGWDFLIETDGRLSLYMAHDDSVNNEVYAFSTGTIPTADSVTWSHVVVTSDGTGTAAGIKFYINSVTSTTTNTHDALSGTIVNSANFHIGNAWNTAYFNGNLNQVSYWTIAMNQTQINTLYNFTSPANLTGSSNLSNWWYLGGGTDTSSTIFDHVGSVNLTPTGTTAIQSVVPLPLQ